MLTVLRPQIPDLKDRVGGKHVRIIFFSANLEPHPLKLRCTSQIIAAYLDKSILAAADKAVTAADKGKVSDLVLVASQAVQPGLCDDIPEDKVCVAGARSKQRARGVESERSYRRLCTIEDAKMQGIGM